MAPPERKKLGKNLTKLVQPTALSAPPIAAHDPYAKYGSGRNGLLLLSTQRKSSTATANGKSVKAGSVSTNGTSSVFAKTGSTASNSSFPQSSSNQRALSTHDVLLSAVTGRRAWNDGTGTAGLGTTSTGATTPDAWGTQQQQNTSRNGISESALMTASSEMDAVVSNHGNNTSNAAVDASINVAPEDDPQSAYMRKLAKERSEQRAAEEAARMEEQRERAAIRLRALDQGDRKAQDAAVPAAAWDPPRTNGAARTLWEPQAAASVPENQKSQKKPTKATEPTASRVEVAEPASSSSNTMSTAALVHYDGAVIHLNSYEDRDRGERNQHGGPRMLYDPKSGAMVAVKARDEAPAANSSSNHNSNRTNGKKERTSIKSKARDSQTNGRLESRDYSADTAHSNGQSDRRQKADKEAVSSTSSSAKADATATAVAAKKKMTLLTRRRFPRTCGVLYTRDDKGSVVSADGCEGDLGYGCHSVPGGRARNATAYVSLLKAREEEHQKRQQQQKEAQQQHKDEHRDVPEGMDMYDGLYDYYSMYYDGNSNNISLYSGFKLEDEEEEEEEEIMEPIEWVKADDKIELITGADDSPTLKPTAKEWAPSQAALAAAAAAAVAKDAGLGGPPSSVHESVDQSDDDGDPVENMEDFDVLGLGFDPSQDMDGLMLSPTQTHDRTGRLGTVDLNALDLESAAVFSATGGLGKSTAPRHIFAFGTSGTWADEAADAVASGDWDVTLLSSTNGNGIPSSAAGLLFADPFGTTTEKASSFLNLAALGGMTLAGVEDSKSTGE